MRQQRARVLVVEDGHEYLTNLERFLGEDFEFQRAGDGLAALEMLSAAPFYALFLDMRFDRAERLLGDLDELVDRFAGDRGRARRFLEDHQGTYVLSALREAGARSVLLGPEVLRSSTAGPAAIAVLSALVGRWG